MKKLFPLIIIIFFLIGCGIKQKHLEYYISTLENIKTLPISKEDSANVLKNKLSAESSFENCRKLHGSNCINDIEILSYEANFKDGPAKFREILFEKFNLPKTAEIGENRVRVFIGAKDDLEKIEILKYTDEDTKKAVEAVFKLKELTAWKSTKIYGVPVKQQFEISIFIKRK
jgi:hypothetical protein